MKRANNTTYFTCNNLKSGNEKIRFYPKITNAETLKFNLDDINI